MLKRIGLALAVLVLLAAPAVAASPGALALVPEDATAVGFVRVADLRSNPFQLRVFEETDKVTAQGDAARFLSEAGLDLRNDVDSVVACTAASSDSRGRTLVLFEGRYDPAKLAAALVNRGAVRVSAAGGEYFRLKDGAESHEPGALAIVGAGLVAAGNESSVAAALARRASGASGFGGGAGLGRELHRVDPAATAWILLDVQKSHAYRSGGGNASGVMNALKSVSLAAMQATVEGDALTVKAIGLSDDEETRELLEDSLRGLTAAWRMAAQEKNPDLVAAIRKFQVTRDGEGVTIAGTLPGDLIRSMTAEARSRGSSSSPK
ncbi:MAG TPA: hypothetical protein VIA45_18255 [Thermoanaerobaculia bacterium]|jgi:hypothetical protein